MHRLFSSFTGIPTMLGHFERNSKRIEIHRLIGCDLEGYTLLSSTHHRAERVSHEFAIVGIIISVMRSYESITSISLDGASRKSKWKFQTSFEYALKMDLKAILPTKISMYVIILQKMHSVLCFQCQLFQVIQYRSFSSHKGRKPFHPSNLVSEKFENKNYRNFVFYNPISHLRKSRRQCARDENYEVQNQKYGVNTECKNNGKSIFIPPYQTQRQTCSHTLGDWRGTKFHRQQRKISN